MSSMNFTPEEILEFSQEAEDLLQISEQCLLALENLSPFKENYDSIFRSFHSIKGAAGMLGMDSLQKHMHIVESNFQSLKEHESITKDQISYFLKAVDHSRLLLNSTEVAEFSEVFKQSSSQEINKNAENLDIISLTPTANPQNAVSALKAIVVDDEEHLVEILKELLEFVGFEVHAFNKPEEAVKALWNIKPDVVCTDMKMPVLSGFDVLKKIQEFDEDIPVIFISGHMDKEMIIDLVSKGVYSVIEKPFKDTVVFNTALTAAKRYKTMRLLTKTVNLLMANINELADYLGKTGKEDEAKIIKNELNQLIQARRELRERKSNIT